MTMLNLRYRSLLAAFSLPLFALTVVAASAQAEVTASHHSEQASAEPSHPSSYTLRAEVVELQGDRVLLKHQAVAALNWPAMTMPFQLASAKLAQGLTPGLQIEAQFAPVANDSPRILQWQAVK